MFKRDRMVVRCADRPIESFVLHDGVGFTSYIHDGCEKLCLNCWVDFVDCDDSELFGGSEIYALIWGLRVSLGAFLKKGTVVEAANVSFELNEDADASALFFSSEFHRISELRLKTTGQGRFQMHLRIEDVTGRSDAVNTEMWIDGKLRDEACEMSYPQ